MPSQSRYYSMQFVPITTAEDIDACFELLAERLTGDNNLEITVAPEANPTPHNRQEARHWAKETLKSYHSLQAIIRNPMNINPNERRRFSSDVHLIINVPSRSRKDVWQLVREAEEHEDTAAYYAEMEATTPASI